MRKVILLLTLMLIAATGWAQAYKWRDASGRIQYSDTPPPPGAKDVQQLRRPAPGPATSSGAVTGGKSVLDQEADFNKRLADRLEAEAKQAKALEMEQAKARNCELAKGQLATLESGVNLVQFNEKGERVVLDDTEINRRKAEARQNVDTWCK